MLQALLDDIAGALQILRARAGLTQKQAAKAGHTTPARISDLENAKCDVFVSTLQKIANGYGYDLEIHFVPREEEDAGEQEA